MQAYRPSGGPGSASQPIVLEGDRGSIYLNIPPYFFVVAVVDVGLDVVEGDKVVFGVDVVPGAGVIVVVLDGVGEGVEVSPLQLMTIVVHNISANKTIHSFFILPS
jgi:hypothetical protein